MKKMGSIFLALTLLTGVLAGCSTKEQISKPTKSETTTKTTSEAKKEEEKGITANLRVLYPGTSDIEKELAEDIKIELQKKHPGIEVEYIYLSWADMEKKLAVMIQSGDYPDIMQIQDIANPVAMEALEPIKPYLEKEFDINSFSKAALERMTKDDELYGVPVLSIAYSHIINEKLLNNAGMKVEDIKTWDDVLKAVTLMTKDGANGYAMANGGEGRFTFRDFMMISLSNGFNPSDVSEQTKAKYIETLQFLKDLGASMPKSQVTWLYPELFKAWEADQVGMIHTGSYFTSNIVSHGTNSIKHTKVVPMPKGPSVDKTQVMVGAVGWSMISGSEQKEAAWEFMKVALSEPIVSKFAGSMHVPAVDYANEEIMLESAKTAYGDSAEAHIALVADMKKAVDDHGVPMPIIVGQSAMEKVVQNAVVEMIDGKTTAEEAYEKIKQGISALQ